MKARPILFSTPMVRALLDGTKTQTRRIVKHPENWKERGMWDVESAFGIPGDLLWVREAFLYRGMRHWVVRRADMKDGEGAGFGALYGGWKPSIHMPKAASRLTLEITDVRIERLQDISEHDAQEEGAERISSFENQFYNGYRVLWQRINGVKSWSENPWVWAITFNVHHKNIGEFTCAS